MIYAPKQDKTARWQSLLFIITGFALMMFSSFVPYRAVYQVLALLTVVVGIFILVRYVLSEFRYIIDDRDDGNSDFIVYKKQGKNDVKVCHISLFNVEEIYRHGDKKVKSDNRYAYNQNITHEKYVLLTREGEKIIEIIIEPDKYFLEQIKKRAGSGMKADNNLIM